MNHYTLSSWNTCFEICIQKQRSQQLKVSSLVTSRNFLVNKKAKECKDSVNNKFSYQSSKDH